MKSTAWPRSMSAWPTAHIAWLFPTPGRPNAKTLVASSRKSPSASSWRRRTSAGGKRAFIERGERFARRQLGRPAQARDAALVSLLRFELQDVEQQRERRLLLRLDEPRDHLARGRRERKPGEQGRDLIADGARRGGAAHAAAPARSAS